MVDYLLDSYPHLQQMRRKIKIVPVTINYERFLDAKDVNLMGSTYEIIRQIFKLPPQSLGNVFVKYGEPIDLHSYIQDSKSNTSGDLQVTLTQDLYKMHQKNLIVSTNALISSVFLNLPEGELAFKKVKKLTNGLYEHCYKRKHNIVMSLGPQNYDITKAAESFKLKVIGKPLDRKLGEKASIQLKKVEGLEFHQEEMVAQFSQEGMVALALQMTTRIDEIMDITKRLIDVFKNEFVPLAIMKDDISKEYVVKLMKQWHEIGILTYDDQN